MNKSERYEFIRAIVDGDDLSWEYKLNSSKVTGRLNHDEDVSEFSESEIRRLTWQVLDVIKDDYDKVEVIYA